MSRPMNVLLVYPEIPDNTYWSFSGALPFIGKRVALPPLGLATLAAMLPPQWSLRLIDSNITVVSDADLQWAHMVLLSAMIIQAPSFHALAMRARAHGCKVVAGGPYPSQYYGELEVEIDHLLLGEAESGVLSAFIADLDHNRARRIYARLTLRRDRDGHSIDAAELQRLRAFAGCDADIAIVEQRPSLHDSPLPRFDLLDLKQYGSMAIQLSRGCPYDCDFCNEPAFFGHQPRLKTAVQINRELQSLYDLGFRGPIFFVDDNFIGNISQVNTVLKHIGDFQQQHNFPFSFYTEASINLAHEPPLMQAMAQAGFNMVFVGIETTDTATLQAANKLHNTRADLLTDVGRILQHGIEVTAGFIIGMDAEPEDACEQIFQFVQTAGIPTVMVSLLTPLRGSKLYERLHREKRLCEARLLGNNTHNFELHFRPDRGRDPQQIVNQYKQLLRRLYDRSGRNYFARCQRLLEQIHTDTPTCVRPVRAAEALAAWRSLCRQSCRSYSLAYARLLVNCICHRRRQLPEAIRLAITGHHLLQITRYALEAEKVREELRQRLERLRQLLSTCAVNGEKELQERLRCAGDEACQSWRKAERRIRRLPQTYRHELQIFCNDCEQQFKRFCDSLCSKHQQRC